MPEIGDGNYHGQALKLADLAVPMPIVDDCRFVKCNILGPAIIIPRECTFTGCSWDSPEGLNSLFWDIAPERTLVIGAILVTRCMFIDCHFQGVGIAGPSDMREAFERGFAGD